MKLEHKDGVVKAIWFECRTAEPDDIFRLRAALVALNAIVPSAVVDYWINAVGPVGDQEFLGKYFEDLQSSAD